MKPWIWKLLIGATGFGGGFAAGFFCHRRINDLKFEEITKEEMARIEEEQKKKDFPSPPADIPQKKDRVTEAIESSKAEVTCVEQLPPDPDEMRNALQGKVSYLRADAEQKMAYDKLWKATKAYSNEENANRLPVEKSPSDEDEAAEGEYPEEEEFDEDFLEQIEQEAAEAGNSFVEPPHQIDLAAFYNERQDDYDKITIHYYEPDRQWIDERGDPIRDISSYLGTDGEGIFSRPGPDDDPDVRFVRNDRYHTDYEVIRHHISRDESARTVPGA